MNKLDEKFKRHWKAYKIFLEKRGRRPSAITDSVLFRWYNLNKSYYQKGLLTLERSAMIAALLDDGATFKESIAIGKTSAKNSKEAVVEKKIRKPRTQDSKWISQYNAYMDCLIKNHQRPSKYEAKYAVAYSWFKHNKKLYRQGLLKPERIEKFEKLLEIADKYQRVNQYKYVDSSIKE